MLVLLLMLGFAIGNAVAPGFIPTHGYPSAASARSRALPIGGLIGVAVAFVIWSINASVAFFAGDKILLAVSRSKPIEKADHPQLFNIVEEMTIAANLPKMPDIYVIDDMALNAFATGRKPENAAISVTAGMLGRLNRDQLQGVVAHEMTHILNRDVLLMTMVGIMLGSIVMMSELFLRGLWYSNAGSSRRYRSDKDDNSAQLIFIAIAVVLAIVAPVLAQLIYFAVSRRREYIADAGGAVLTRYPEGLASALEVLAADTHQLQSANRATAPMFIINPLHAEGAVAFNLTATHPPIEDRIKVLRSMAGGVSYAAYQEALEKTGARGAGALPASALAQPGAPARAALADAAPEQQRNPVQMRQAGDLLRKLNKFRFLTCACGMHIKLPPDFEEPQVECPRCHAVLAVPNS